LHSARKPADTPHERFQSKASVAPFSLATGQNHNKLKPLNSFRVRLSHQGDSAELSGHYFAPDRIARHDASMAPMRAPETTEAGFGPRVLGPTSERGPRSPGQRAEVVRCEDFSVQRQSVRARPRVGRARTDSSRARSVMRHRRDQTPGSFIAPLPVRMQFLR